MISSEDKVGDNTTTTTTITDNTTTATATATATATTTTNNNKTVFTEKETDMNKAATTALTKLGGFQFFRELGSPKLVVAPMIDHTYLAFRMLCRKYSADLVYTPMFHSKLYVTDPTYRAENFETCPQDRPLVVQFCGNEVHWVVEAAKMVQDRCDAVDLNLGCPQGIARRGNYGAFLLEKPDVILPIVRELHRTLKVPVFCKIRLLPSLDDTIKLALQLQEAGCQLLTVHGRTKEQKGQFNGIANWKAIKAIKDALTIPVYANGSVNEYEDIERCLEETGAEGVMSADGILANPAMFSGLKIPITDMLKTDCDYYEDLRTKLGRIYEAPDFWAILDEVDRRNKDNVPKVRMLTNKEKRELKAQEDAAAKAGQSTTTEEQPKLDLEDLLPPVVQTVEPSTTTTTESTTTSTTQSV
eukprot:gene14080-16596_t